MTILMIDDLSVHLATRCVLRNISMDIKSGEMVGLLGPNGSGKTTLVKALAGLLIGSSGAIYLDGRLLHTLPSLERARHIAYLPQRSEAYWWPIRVRDIVALGRLPYGNSLSWYRRWRRYLPVDDVAVTAALRETDTEVLAEHPLTELSGGEQARVLLARALAVEAQILLADEPIAHLDPSHQIRLLALLRQQTMHGVAVLVVLHNLTLAAHHCDRVVVLDRGSIVALGPPEQVLDDKLIERVYSIRVIRGTRYGVPFLLPWELLAS